MQRPQRYLPWYEALGREQGICRLSPPVPPQLPLLTTGSQSVSKPKLSAPKTFVQQPSPGTRFTSSSFALLPKKRRPIFIIRQTPFLNLYNCHYDARALGHQPLGPLASLSVSHWHCDRPPPPPPRNHVKPPKNISRLLHSPSIAILFIVTQYLSISTCDDNDYHNHQQRSDLLVAHPCPLAASPWPSEAWFEKASRAQPSPAVGSTFGSPCPASTTTLGRHPPPPSHPISVTLNSRLVARRYRPRSLDDNTFTLPRRLTD